MNRFAQIPCGSGLAPDSGVSVDTFIGCKAVIGSKPPRTLLVFASGDRHG